MTTHPILGPIASVHALGVATLAAIKANSGCSIPTMLAEINARALESAASLAAPPAQWGWVMVPRIPTPEMDAAGKLALSENGVEDVDTYDALVCYEAMLSAAPQPAPAPSTPPRDREADRERFPDAQFNAWMDEGISDCGHTVWDSIGDVCAAWHGWQARQYAQPPAPGEVRLPPLPQAFFDEFGKGADDRVQDYARAAIAALAQQQDAKAIVDHMVNRFLSWKLPQDFAPDCGISFAPLTNPEWTHDVWPIGTNLLHAGQAKALVEHMLAGIVTPTSIDAQRRVPDADEPDQALLISMATCLNHGFGMLGPQQQASMLHDMRKLWDEVQGRGYYTPANRGRYLAALNDSEPLADFNATVNSQPEARGNGD